MTVIENKTVVATNRIGAQEFVTAISKGLEVYQTENGLTDEKLYEIQDRLSDGIKKYGFGSLAFVEKTVIDESLELFVEHLANYRYVETTNLRGETTRGWNRLSDLETWNREDFENIIWDGSK